MYNLHIINIKHIHILYKLTENSDHEIFSKKALKLANFESLRFYHLKIQHPTTWELIYLYKFHLSQLVP